ncbi:MAG: hypothetical protein ACM3XP_00535 [Nitrososphaerales archaeon]
MKSVLGQIIIEIIQGKTFDYLFNAEFLPTKNKRRTEKLDPGHLPKKYLETLNQID